MLQMTIEHPSLVLLTILSLILLFYPYIGGIILPTHRLSGKRKFLKHAQKFYRTVIV